MRIDPARAAEPVPRSSLPVPAASWLGRITALILFLGLALGLVLPKVAGGAFLLLALMGIIWLEPGLARRRWDLDGHERLLIFAVLAFVVVWLLAWLVHGVHPIGAEDVGRILRLLLIVPVYIFLRHTEGLREYWWWGLSAGAAVAGVHAIAFTVAGDTGEWLDRVGGATNPIYFGGIVLAFSLMILPRITDASLPLVARAAFALSAGLGLVASALSGSRGAWLVIPVLLVIYMFTVARSVPARQRFGMPLMVVAMVVAIAVVPGVPLLERLFDAWKSLSVPSPGFSETDTLAMRWQLWQLSVQAIAEHPLFGGGPGLFRAALEQAVAQGAANPFLLRFHHPHNQYLSALLIGGIPGLLALVALFGVPGRFCARGLFFPDRQSQYVAWSGLAAVAVIATMAAGESIFQRNSGIVWFALLTSVSCALVRRERNDESAAST